MTEMQEQISEGKGMCQVSSANICQNNKYRFSI